MTAVRAGLLVFFFSVAAYASSLGNGFAYDDEKVVRENQVVTAGDWGERPTGLRWPGWRPREPIRSYGPSFPRATSSEGTFPPR